MTIVYGKDAYNSVADITGPSGWYGIKAGAKTVPVYVDQDYLGGGWACVLANRSLTGGMNNLNYQDAIHGANYRSEPSVNNGTNYHGKRPTTTSSLADFNIWIGLNYWKALAGRQTTDKITALVFSAATNGTTLSGTHIERQRWQFDRFDQSTWAFVNPVDLGVEAGGTVSGMYGYHIVGGFSLSTYDSDNDVNTGNCSTYYNNNPWWYGNCWSGNIFGGGGGYVDGPYWDSSIAGYERQYMAVYIK